MSSIVKHTNVKVVAEKASSSHETHFLQLNDQLELKTSDEDVLTQLTSLDGNLVDIENILNTQTTELTAIKDNTHNIKASIELGGDLYVSQDEVEAKLQTIADQTVNNGGIYTAQVHIRDINLPQLHSDINRIETLLSDVATETTLSSVLGDTNIIAENITLCDTDNVTVISTVLPSGASTSTLQTTSNGFLEQIEAHIETMSENQSTFASGDEVIVTGVSTSALQSTTHGKLDILETSNQLIKNNGIRAWGTTQTIEGNLIVLAGATHSGSSSFTTIPTKPILIYVKSHNVITDWFAAIEGSIDNTNWLATTAQSLPIINLTGLGRTPAQQGVAYIDKPPFPYLRLRITNANAANRGFEIKIIQTT